MKDIMKEYILTDIEWDKEGEDISLPTTVSITVKDDEDVVDALSDKYGFCIHNVRIIRKM